MIPSQRTIGQVTRMLLCMLWLIGLFFGPAPRPAAALDTVVYFDPAVSNVSVGAQFDVAVRIRDVTNLGCVDLQIQFDSSILQVVGSAVQPGNIFPSDTPTLNWVLSGQIFYTISALNSAPFSDDDTSDDGTICTIRFEAIQNGTSSLTFSALSLGQAPSCNTSIVATVQDGTVNVGAVATATPTATHTPTHTATHTATSTSTSTSTPMHTSTSTATPTASPTSTTGATETPTSTPTATFTPTPSATETSTSTPTAGPSPTPTETSTPGPSATPTDTSTPGPSPTATSTSTPGPSATSTSTSTSVPSPTASLTPGSPYPGPGTKTVWLPLIMRPAQPTPTPTATPSPLPAGCVEGIVNGSFETNEAWYIPYSHYSAAYSTAVARTGLRSMRMGIVDPADNRYSFSDAGQVVSIPSSALSARLRFHLYTLSGEPPILAPATLPPIGITLKELRESMAISDMQYLLVLDMSDTVIGRPLWQRRNDRQWVLYEVDLMSYRGQTIKLQWGVQNDGYDGITAMYMDDVSLEICFAPTPTPTATRTATFTPTATDTPTATFTPSLTPTPTATWTPSPTYTPSATPTPTYTPTATDTPTATLTPSSTPTPTATWTPSPTYTPSATPTPTYTPTASNTPTPTWTFTPTPTATPTSPYCSEGIVNGSFETDAAWVIPYSHYPAAYSTAVVRTGLRSMRMGIVDPADNRYSFSDAAQTVTIPSSVVSARLRFWLYTMSDEPPALALGAPPAIGMSLEEMREQQLISDMQYLLIIDPGGTVIGRPLWQRRNDRQWMLYEVDLIAYRGQTIRLQFGVQNDGYNGLTAMYMDDVSLELCTQPLPTTDYIPIP